MSDARKTSKYGLYLAYFPDPTKEEPPANCPENTVVLCPVGPNSSSSSSSSSSVKEGYMASLVRNGKWYPAEAVYIGNYTLTDLNKAVLVDGKFHSLPVTPHHFNIIKIAFAKVANKFPDAKISLPINEPNLFLDQADDMLREEYADLSRQDQGNLTHSTRRTNVFFRSQLSRDDLVTCTFRGEEDKIKKAVQQMVAEDNSKLFFEEGRTQNDYGEEIKGFSAFEVALRADDYEMLEAMFPCIERNVEKAIEQYCKARPQDRKYFLEFLKKEEQAAALAEAPVEKPKEQKQEEFDFGEYKDLVDAIDKETFDNPIPCHIFRMESLPQGVADLPADMQAAFIRSGERLFYLNRETNEYREYDEKDQGKKMAFLGKFDRELRSEMSPRILSPEELGQYHSQGPLLVHEKINVETAKVIKAFREKFKPEDTLRQGEKINYIAEMLQRGYRINKHRFDPWNIEQLVLFARVGIGYPQRYLATSWKQAVPTGVENVASGKKLDRGVPLIEGLPFSFSSLGFSRYVDIWFGGGGGWGAGSRLTGGVLILWDKLCEMKTVGAGALKFREQLKNLAQNLRQTKGFGSG